MPEKDFPARESIGWVDNAIESQSTDLLARQWAEVEKVFHGENAKPEGMSDSGFQETLLWRRAFNMPKFGSQSTYNFDKNSNMPISLHIKEKYPNFVHKEVDDYQKLATPGRKNFLWRLMFDEKIEITPIRKSQED